MYQPLSPFSNFLVLIKKQTSNFYWYPVFKIDNHINRQIIQSIKYRIINKVALVYLPACGIEAID